MANTEEILSLVDKHVSPDRFREQHWEGSFSDYLDLVTKNPRIARNAFQRIYDMIMHFGLERYTRLREEMTHYKFFDDPIGDGVDAIFGLDRPLMNLVDFFKSAAHRYGTERRILLLHGPVGSSKSTIARLLKKGIERYSTLDEGALYTFSWEIPDEDGKVVSHRCPMHEEPLKLIPVDARKDVLANLNSELNESSQICVEGALDPFCRKMFDDLSLKYEGNWRKVIAHIRVHRIILSEKDRVGIGTFQPKDEKNQDSTELTGDINYRKIAEYGSDSDPRAFNFDGELNVANRGMVEFIEVLKLDVAFLYDLLGASQEHVIKPKKFAQTSIDEVILGHTNEPEYKKLQSNDLMEAFRDRTIKIDIPYNVKLDDEIAIYTKDFNKERIRGIHIAPHTIETAAMWAVLTRMEDPKKPGLTLMQKLKLYNGKSIPNFTEDSVRELREESPREGMQGISPRYIQDKLSNALVSDYAIQQRSINPFMVMNELETGLSNHSLLTDEELKTRYRELLTTVREEYEDILKSEVQRAISADEDAIARLCSNYIENVRAYTQHEKVRNKYTGKDEEPDERLMRSIEEKIDIPESRKDDFRQEIMNYIGALSLDGKKFEYHTNVRLQKALELKLFEDQRDTIKLKNVVSGVGKGDGQPGDTVQGEGGEGQGGTEAGNHILEVDVTLDELADILGEELKLPRIEPKGKHRISSEKDRYSGIRTTGPESLRHFRRTFHRALRRQIMSGMYNPDAPRILFEPRDKVYRSWKTVLKPQSNAVIIYMMDVSGSMGDEQKELVRLKAFWIDAWLRKNYQGIESRYIVHDVRAAEVDRETFFRIREDGGTRISSAFRLARDLIDNHYAPAEWNIYLFHFSDGDNSSESDSRECCSMLKDYLLERVNMFGYCQVASAYGSGNFINVIHEHLSDEEAVITTRVNTKDDIYDSIKGFFAAGR